MIVIEKLINNLPFLVLSIVLLPLLGQFILKYYNNRKSFKIEGNTIFNFNSNQNCIQNITSSKNYFNNKIYHQISILNKSETSYSINKIVLNQIKFKDIQVYDIKFDGGFYSDKQKFCLIGYNNGNTKFHIKKLFIKIFISDEILLYSKLIDSIEIQNIEIESGHVKALVIRTFEKYTEFFKSYTKFNYLELKVFDEECKFIEGLSLSLLYSKEENKFNNMQFGDAGTAIDVVPVFIIGEKSNKLEVATNQKLLSKEISEVGFVIEVEKNCNLKYNVELYSGNMKISSKSSFSLDIRIPIYKQVNSTFYGSFYLLILMNNLSLSNFNYSTSDIRKLDSNLLYLN